MLFLSADNPLLADEPLYQSVKSIFMTGYEGVIVDEIHYARDWSRHPKALYDDFPAHRLWISDSSTLVLRTGFSDTSRRFVPVRLPLLSFREFLFLETGTDYETCNPFKEYSQLPLHPGPAILAAFQKYRTCGTRPFYGEGNFQRGQGADSVIRDDIDYPAGKVLPLWLLGMGW